MQNMPQDSLRSVVYRSFVTCDDPRGVVECKLIRKSKTKPSNMLDHRAKQRAHNNLNVSLSKKGEIQEMVLNSASSVQLEEVSKGARNLIDSLSRGTSFERDSKDIAKELLRGALDLQESLVTLGKLQEASEYVSKLKQRPKEIGRAKSERIGDHRYEMVFENPRFSVDGASRDCYEDLREVIRESFTRQNLLPPSYPVKRVSFEFPSTSSSQSSIFESKEFPSYANSLPKVKEEKPKGPSLIAKLMGLEEISSQKPLEKDGVFNQRRPIFEIDLPNAKKPPFLAHKVDPKRKTLEEIIETMQLKGLLKSKFVDGSKHEMRFDGGEPIVVMKPFYAPDLQEERFYTSTSPRFECACVNEEKVRRSRREEFLPETKGASGATFYRSSRTKNGQITNSIQGKGAKEHRQTHTNPNENGTKVHAKPSSIKHKSSDPGKPRQQKKEAIEKRPDKIQKVDSNSRKTEGIKNAKVRDSIASSKLRKADSVPHISEKQVTQQKSSTSDHASKRASHNSRNRKNMKTDKPLVSKQVEKKGDKDVHIDHISKKETYKTDTKVEASEKLYSLEASDVYENHITDDQISDESLPSDSTMPTVACDINVESTERENSCTSPILNEKTTSEPNSATRRLLLSSASFLREAEELFGTDAESFKQDCSQNGTVETKLLLDCAHELLNNKKSQITLSFDPLSKKPVRTSCIGIISLDKLVSEICEGIENLTMYKDPSGTLSVDTLTKKDLWCKGVVSGTWDSGWSEGFTSDEIEKVVSDMEKQLLCGIIEDILADFGIGI